MLRLVSGLKVGWDVLWAEMNWHTQLCIERQRRWQLHMLSAAHALDSSGRVQWEVQKETRVGKENVTFAI